MKKVCVLLLFLILFITGCQISDKRAKVSFINPVDSRIRDFILIGDKEYQGELTVALAGQGFNLKPISLRQSVKEVERPWRMVEYEEAGSRYAIQLVVVKHDYLMECVFSDNHMVEVTMSVIDIRENNTLLVIKQYGPDGECPPLTPVWELLAIELKKNWK